MQDGNVIFWPEKIESTQDEMTLRFLEDHLVMIPMEPRRPGCSLVDVYKRQIVVRRSMYLSMLV